MKAIVARRWGLIIYLLYIYITLSNYNTRFINIVQMPSEKRTGIATSAYSLTARTETVSKW